MDPHTETTRQERCCDLAVVGQGDGIDDRVKRLVGQLLICPMEAGASIQVYRTLIESHSIGSIMLRRWTNHVMGQVMHLTQSLQNTASRAMHQQPLLIGIDQEYGLFHEFAANAGATNFPSHLGLAAGNAPPISYIVGRAFAREQNAFGYNWNIGPDISILTDQTESLEATETFGDDPETASDQLLAFTQGLHAGGMVACASKALNITVRTVYQQIHSDNYVDDEVLDLPGNLELQPLRRLIDNDCIDMIKLSASVNSFGDPTITIKAMDKAIDAVLRQELGFQGTVVADCLSWSSENQICTIHAPLRTLLAGSDMVQLPLGLATQIASVDAILAAIERQILPMARVTTSASRVSALKSRYLDWSKTTPLEVLKPVIDGSEHREIAQSAFRASITVLQDTPCPLMFLSRESVILLLTPMIAHNDRLQTHGQEEPSDPFESLGRALSRSHPRIRHVPYTLSQGLTSTHMAFLHRVTGVVLVLACPSSAFAEAQSEVWHGIEGILSGIDRNVSLPGQMPRVVIGAGDIRDLFAQPELLRKWWSVECWDWKRGSLEAVAEVINGEQEATGTLPVRRPH